MNLIICYQLFGQAVNGYFDNGRVALADRLAQKVVADFDLFAIVDGEKRRDALHFGLFHQATKRTTTSTSTSVVVVEVVVAASAAAATTTTEKFNSS